LLSCAGLTVVEDVCPGGLFPPEAGRRIARGIAAPDGAVREALDAVWWRRLADAGGEFLVAVLGHRIGGNDAWWTRVRYAGDGVPGLTGEPGFVALSLDGQVLLAEVPGADGSRVTALDRLPERLEEAAAAAGRETEAERAEVWVAVPGQPAWPLHWREGIGSNPAAPDELLIRLLDVGDGLLHGCDRPAVLDAAVAHPDPRVRSRAADTFRPKLTSGQWVRLVRAEPSPSRRVLWAEQACAWGVELPADLYDDLLVGPSRAQAAELPGLPAHHLPGLAADADRLGGRVGQRAGGDRGHRRVTREVPRVHQVADHHAGSLVGEAPRDRAPEPVGAAGHHRDHAVEPAVPPATGPGVRRDMRTCPRACLRHRASSRAERPRSDCRLSTKLL